VDDVAALAAVAAAGNPAAQLAISAAGGGTNARGGIEIGLLPLPPAAPLDEHHQSSDIISIGGRYGDRQQQQQQHTDLAVWRPY